MRIIITGANRGLGRYLTEEAASRGHQVAAGVRHPEQPGELAGLMARYPGRIFIVPLDVANEASIAAAAETVRAHWGGVDAILNNAGILLGRGDTLESLNFDDVEATFQVNLYGPMKVCKHFLPLMEASGGEQQAVIHISSEAGAWSNAYGGDYSYALSKAALNYFSAQLRKLLQARDVRVLAVHPGWIKTDMGGERAPGNPAESAAGILDLIERKTGSDSDSVFVDFRGQPMH